RGSLTGTCAASRNAASAEPLYTSYRPTTSAMNSVSNVPRSSSWASSVQYSSVLYSCARLAGCRHRPVVWCVTHVMSKALRMMRSDTSGAPGGWREPADGEPSHGSRTVGSGRGWGKEGGRCLRVRAASGCAISRLRAPSQGGDDDSRWRVEGAPEDSGGHPVRPCP